MMFRGEPVEPRKATVGNLQVTQESGWSANTDVGEDRERHGFAGDSAAFPCLASQTK